MEKEAPRALSNGNLGSRSTDGGARRVGRGGQAGFLISSPVLQIRPGSLSPPWFPWQQHEDEEPCPGFADAEVGIPKVLELWGREGVPRAPLSPSAAELPPGATIPPQEWAVHSTSLPSEPGKSSLSSSLNPQFADLWVRNASLCFPSQPWKCCLQPWLP